MQYKGYIGKILKVNLTERKTESILLSEKIAMDYIGGVGLATKIISTMVRPAMDPFSENNPLVFMTGPMTGTNIPWSGRHCVAAISPLTGLLGEAYSGGTWARELKKAGFDGIVITGKAEKLVYLKIIDQTVTIEDAAPLRGKDTFETEALLQKYCQEHVKVAAIGTAGENLVRFAAVIHDGPAARTAARCGVGAVMGSKNLKAIAVKGSQIVQVADEQRLKESINDVMPELTNDPVHRLKKSRFIYSTFIDSGRNSVHNWRDDKLEGYKEAVLKAAEMHEHEGKPYYCAGCRTGCVESHMGKRGRLLHWESFAPLGSQCGMTDMEYVQQAFDICNRHGVDSISAGGVISFAMECFEEGIISENDTGGIQLRFGNGDAMLTMLEKVCKKEDFGAVLAEGTRRAAKQIGKGSEKFALEVKGLEVPAHDPRSHNFLALIYATANRGACHTEANDKLDDPGLELNGQRKFAVQGMADKVIRGQHYFSVINSMGVCAFCVMGEAQNNSPENFWGLKPSQIIQWFNLATGMERDLASLMHSGEKIFNLKRLINLTLGLDPASDCLPERFITIKKKQGPAAGHLPQVKEMVEDYYHLRGWEANGKVTSEKLQELGLESWQSETIEGT
jgi:aldehyde:ferredoxin oxidoreductase